MDGTTGKPDGAGSHFWLRHAMQVTVGEHTHTIEMSVPIPIGASAEVRERLLREAEAGMWQLANTVEGHATQLQQSNVPSASIPPAPKHPQPSVGAPLAHSVPQTGNPLSEGQVTLVPTTRLSPPTPSSPTGASSSPPATPTAMRLTGRQRETLSGEQATANKSEAAESKSNEVTVPPSRPNIGASMPSTPGDTSESLKLPQFIQSIKDTLSLTPKQAMELLNVKSLSGLNLRDAFEQLQQLMAQDANGQTQPAGGSLSGGQGIGNNSEAAESKQTGPTTPDQKLRIVGGQAETRGDSGRSTSNDGEPKGGTTKPGMKAPPTGVSASRARPEAGPTGASPVPATTPAVAGPKVPGIKEITRAVVRENPPAFDEEIDLEDDLEIDFEGDEEMQYLPELTDQERAIAEHVLSRLKEARGSSAASESRLKVLHNVLNEQISGEQLQQLIQGVWGAATLKKLKNDQLEALISWVKEDDFVGEAKMVLAVLQEDQYARSDR